MRIIILAILFFTGFEAISLKTIAQEDTAAKNDNYILFKYMYELNRAVVIKNMALADTLNIEKINAAIKISNSSYQSGSICYSQDKSFKIISAEGSDCNNKNCICLSRSRLYFAGTDKSIDMVPGFLYVDTIFKLAGNNYLALQSSSGCNGTPSASHKRATLFSIAHEKITYYPISDKKDTTANSDHGLDLFQYTTEGLEKYPFILTFDVANKRLIYSYILDTDSSLNSSTENYVSGYYEYKNGSFRSNKSVIKKVVKR
jgi:hypothetical protein